MKEASRGMKLISSRLAGIYLTMALFAIVQWNASGASNYTLQNCKLISPKKSATSATHPVLERQGEVTKFFPYLKIRVVATIQRYCERMSGIVHYFSPDGRLMATEEAFPISRGQESRAFPDYLRRGKPDHVFFRVPPEIGKRWSAVIVIGDQDDKAVATWPQGTNWRKFDFPEKAALRSNSSGRISEDLDPVAEFVFDTQLASHPRITFMLRKPKGSRSFADAKGVLALCLLANSVEEVRDRLQKAEMNDDLTGILAYAEKRKLVIICWGAWRYWDPNANWEDLEKPAERGISDASRENAAAWSRGMKALAIKYHLPLAGYLLCGFSASAQFSIRLAMRRPELFKAVYVHIPSSFPKPEPSAQNVMWCLTTGEMEAGYDRSIAFLEAAQTAGYSMIYKAIPRLGHSSHPQADRICEAFFDYATGVCTNVLTRSRYGDVFRQTVVGESERMSRKGLYVPLPTEQIVEAWRSDCPEKGH
jgi:predicted esterase